MPTATVDPPPGVEPNFENPNREMYYICIASNAIAIPVCTVFVVLRIWTRIRLSMRLQADDIACILGYIGFMGYCSICLLMLRYGGGIHQWEVPEELIQQYFQTVYATMVNYGPTAFATKAAILLFLIRVFAPYKTYVKLIYGFLAVMGLYYLIMLILKIVICRPISFFWGGTADGECFNQRILILVDNVISLISDIVVLMLPCPLTKDLQVGLMAKLKIGVVFGVGGIACIFSLVRLVFIINNGASADQTYAFVQINLTGIAECGIGLVCACFPLMPALWKSIRRKEKPGYSSNAKSQFEMVGSQKNSRNATHDLGTITYRNKETDSDENNLIPHGASYITTNIRAGEEDIDQSSAGAESTRRKPSYEENHIVRTVEVRQYSEQ